jgi:hypothetical protein
VRERLAPQTGPAQTIAANRQQGSQFSNHDRTSCGGGTGTVNKSGVPPLAMLSACSTLLEARVRRPNLSSPHPNSPAPSRRAVRYIKETRPSRANSTVRRRGPSRAGLRNCRTCDRSRARFGSLENQAVLLRDRDVARGP